MRVFFLIGFFAVTLFGCSKLKTGEVWEHKLTGERLMIDRVGQCSELKEHYDNWPESRSHKAFSSDSLKQCISYFRGTERINPYSIEEPKYEMVYVVYSVSSLKRYFEPK